jgi:glycerol-3-phosphate dehydrogenase
MMKRFIEENEFKTYDLIIVGGGISGAAVAYEACSRGLSAALVEKNDFGGATSAATSKLIHGGLRYLANMEIGLVRESLKERRILGNIAPNFVYPVPIIITEYSGSRSSKLMIKSGMMLYDLLAYDRGAVNDTSKKIPGHQSLSPEEALAREPNIRKDGLTGAVIYYDSMNIFPERLTLAFLKSAVKQGADISNYSETKGFINDRNGRISGVRVLDRINGKVKELYGRIVVNCTGPWADITLNMAMKENNHSHKIKRSEGIHIITGKLVNKYIVASRTPSGRHFFLIPWRGHTLIGTTDKEYNGDPDKYSVSRESIQELIDEVNQSFGDGSLTYEDVLFYYGGLRPLIEDPEKDSYQSSRKYEIFDSSERGTEGLITVEGGKYTTSRNLGEKVVDLIEKKLEKEHVKSRTDKEYLYGSEIPEIENFIESAVAENRDFEEKSVRYLARNYGTEFRKVLDIARKNRKYAETLNSDGEVLAQVIFAVKNEMAFTLKDIILRRTGLGTLGNPGKSVLKKSAKAAGRELKWGFFRRRREIKEVIEALRVP